MRNLVTRAISSALRGDTNSQPFVRMNGRMVHPRITAQLPEVWLYPCFRWQCGRYKHLFYASYLVLIRNLRTPWQWKAIPSALGRAAIV